MPNHFTSIGFPIHDEASYGRYAELAWESGSRQDTPGGAYVRWRAGAGAELWLQLDEQERVTGMTPHFTGRVRRRVAVTRVGRRPEESPLDGGMHGWSNPSGDDPESGEYPLVFDLPDFDRVGALALPAMVEVQLAAFAHEVTVHESDEAFAAAQSMQPAFAPESFIPSGLFPVAEGDTAAPPRAEAIFAGHVRESELRTNAVTGAAFRWARVHSYGGELDVVMDPELVSGDIPAGAVLHGSFWLSGRLPDVDPVPRPKRPVWRWVSKA